jgi:MerR family transcriptional regulator, light-induced transcriptional regulator
MSDETSANSRQSGNEAGRREGDDHGDWAETIAALNNQASPLNDNEILELLANVVEGEIIPRLMMAHKRYAPPDDNGPAQSGDVELSDDAIDRFAQMTLADEVDDLEDHVIDLTSQGYSIEQLYLDLLAPAARALGVYWEQDRCSFTEVTLGLGRLQTLLYRLSARQKGVSDLRALVPLGLFITPQDGQHSFGIRMVDDLFRRAGWNTVCEPGICVDQAITLVKSQAFDLVGIGISSEGQIEPARALMTAIRANSRHKQIKLMVGGSQIVDAPELADSLEADLSARDAREAVTIAQNIVYDHRLRH